MSPLMVLGVLLTLVGAALLVVAYSSTGIPVVIGAVLLGAGLVLAIFAAIVHA